MATQTSPTLLARALAALERFVFGHRVLVLGVLAAFTLVMGFLALKLPIQLTVRRVYENGDVGLCVADWSMAGKGPDGKDVKLGGTSAEVVKKTSGGNWVYVIDSPYGTA